MGRESNVTQLHGHKDPTFSSMQFQDGGSQGIFMWNDKEGGFGGFSTSDCYENPGSGSVSENDFSGSAIDTEKIQLIDSDQQQVGGLDDFSGASGPLGLKQTITQSFIDLIESKLNQKSDRHESKHSQKSDRDTNHSRRRLKNSDGEKLKASNIPASLLKIGSWERVSRNDGDLVVKCYYAKRKLVWEMLDGGLKNKIEINWSEISAIRADFPVNQPGILEIQLSHAPSFQRETDPQPRKHTLWQATSDFTGGQAPICRRHYLQFREGEIEKLYEKLLQCDNRLFMLTQKPFPFHESPYFNTNLSSHQDFSFEFNGHQSEYVPRFQFHQFGIERLPLLPCHQVQMFAPTSKLVNDSPDSVSPLSFMNFHTSKEKIRNDGAKHLFKSEEEFRNFHDFHMERGNQVQELPLYTYTNHIGHVLPRSISHSLTSGDRMGRLSSNDWALEEIADQLLNDQVASVCSDDQMLLARVKSMHSLLEAAKEQNPTVQTCTNYPEYSNESSTDNSMTSWSNDQSNENGEFSCQETIRWHPTLSPNHLMHLQRRPSFAYLYLDQAKENFVGADTKMS